MWEILEMAQKAAVEAELVRERCKNLCSQSEEENARMKQNIAKTLEFRVDHERFWVKEVEERIGNVKCAREKLAEANTRLAKSRSKCDAGVNITNKSSQVFKQTVSDDNNASIKYLEEELKMLEDIKVVINSIIGATIEIDKSLDEIGKILENDLHFKYVALNKDKQSLSLKMHSPQLPQLINTSATTFTCQSLLKTKDLEIQNSKKLEQADKQVSSCNLFIAQMSEVMTKLTEKLICHVSKVNNSLSECLRDLKSQKTDLQNHLFLVDSHVSNTEDTILKLQKSICEKENAILLVQGQLQLHRSRPKSELCSDQVERTLESELVDGKREWNSLVLQLPVMNKTLRSLRRSRLQIVFDIGEHSKKIEMVELHCLNERLGLEEIRL